MSSQADWGTPRSRTVTWYDPRLTAEAGRGLAGREFIQAIADGTIAPPPIAAVFGFRIVEVSDGEVCFTATPDESAYNPIGAVHGGLVCTLLDSVAGCAVHTTLAAGTGYTSIEIKVSYVRAVYADTGELTARGWVTKTGRNVAFAEADVRGEDRKLLASASSSFLVIGAGG